MRIETDIKLDFKDVLIRPKRSILSSRNEVSLERSFKFKHSQRSWSGVPIIAANMDTSGTFEMAEALSKHRLVVAIDKHYSEEQLIDFFNRHDSEFFEFVFYALGIQDADYEKFKKINSVVGEKIRNICIDVANGYSERFVKFVQKLRAEFPDKTIMAGNVVTGEMTEALILAGADIVKVGIGSGSVCITRKIAGVGYPQLSAIIECADSAHGLGACICADGGMTCPGDVAKAFGAGADFVLSGSLFAGHEESGGEPFEKDGKIYRKYYGMSSDVAMIKHAGGVAKYRASEGKIVELPCRGPVDGTVQQVLGGLRSACTYVGAARLKDLTKCTTFVRVNQQLNPVYEKFEVDK